MPADKREPTEKEVAAARQAVDKALKALDVPSEQYTKFTGARWTPTRFFSSTKDDPEVKFPAHSSGRRTALAEWIVDRRHPLTARVAANHVWTRHFGTPLVPTVFDFGRKGTPPTNPELLDWLAAELVKSGWNMKHLHRLIVQSSTTGNRSIRSSRSAPVSPIRRVPGGRWVVPGDNVYQLATGQELLTPAGSADERLSLNCSAGGGLVQRRLPFADRLLGSNGRRQNEAALRPYTCKAANDRRAIRLTTKASFLDSLEHDVDDATPFLRPKFGRPLGEREAVLPSVAVHRTDAQCHHVRPVDRPVRGLRGLRGV